MKRYYVQLGSNNRWRASRDSTDMKIWGEHKFRKIIYASSERVAINKAKKLYLKQGK